MPPKYKVPLVDPEKEEPPVPKEPVDDTPKTIRIDY